MNPDYDEFPKLATDLVKLLDERNPHRCLGRDEDPIDAHKRAAVREMIEELLDWMNDESPADE